MANNAHLEKIGLGPTVWNQWRAEETETIPDLSGADISLALLPEIDLSRANLSGANLSHLVLSGANFTGAQLDQAKFFQVDLSGAQLTRANLRAAHLIEVNLGGANLVEADLTGAQLSEAEFSRANLSDANLTGANLSEANLIEANLRGANLNQAKLVGTQLVNTDLSNAMLTGCSIFGVSAWKLKLDGAVQRNLIITDEGEPTITVDNLEVAQFIHLLVNNQQIRHVIDSVTSKVVLILGRFSQDRKPVLDGLRDRLRHCNYLPVLFDFEAPANKDMTGTVETLARMARFIIADLTDPRSVPHELATIVPHLRTTPVLCLRQADSPVYGMFDDLLAYPWVLPAYAYQNQEELLTRIDDKIISPAENKAEELRKTMKRA